MPMRNYHFYYPVELTWEVQANSEGEAADVSRRFLEQWVDQYGGMDVGVPDDGGGVLGPHPETPGGFRIELDPGNITPEHAQIRSDTE